MLRQRNAGDEKLTDVHRSRTQMQQAIYTHKHHECNAMLLYCASAAFMASQVCFASPKSILVFW